MTKRKVFTKALIFSAAMVAKELGVSIRFDPDGSITILPTSQPDLDAEREIKLAEWRLEHDPDFIRKGYG